MAKASGLGKGLSALISERKSTIADVAESTGKREEISVNDILPGPYQPRTIFDEEELNELVESIKRNGILQPILLKKREIGKGYEIIAGERRWRATKKAKLQSIPSIVLDVDHKQAMEIALIENIQRQNLKVLEEAEGYKRLIKEFDYTQEQLADVIGKSRSHVTNILRLTALPEEVKDHLSNGVISTGHARAILSAPDSVEAANQVIKSNLSVRQTENLVKKLSAADGSQIMRKKSYSRKKKNDITDLDNVDNTSENQLDLTQAIESDAATNKEAPTSSQSHIAQKDEEIIMLEQVVANSFGFPVTINNRDESGEIVISYSSMEELNSIISKLEGK